AFYLLLLSRLLFATKNSKIILRYLSVLGRLSRVGEYAWGAAVLVNLYYNLSTPTSDTGGVGGCSPLLQVSSIQFKFPVILSIDLVLTLHFLSGVGLYLPTASPSSSVPGPTSCGGDGHSGPIVGPMDAAD